MRILLLATLGALLAPGPVSASYTRDCLLTGVVTSSPASQRGARSGRRMVQFSFTVQAAEPFELSMLPSDCNEMQGTEISVVLRKTLFGPRIRMGAEHLIRYEYYEDGCPNCTMETYTLVSIRQAKRLRQSAAN